MQGCGTIGYGRGGPPEISSLEKLHWSYQEGGGLEWYHGVSCSYFV